MSILSMNPHIQSLYTTLLFCRQLIRDTDLDVRLSITELLDICDERQQHPGWENDIYTVLYQHLELVSPFYDCGFLDGSIIDGICELNSCFRR